MEAKSALPFYGFLLGSAQYVLPSPTWLFGPLASAWLKFVQAMGVSGYAPEKNDCDKAARLCAAFAGILHARTPGAPNAGLAFGEFWYVRAVGGSHAINVAIAAGDQPTTFDLLFMEPQNGKQVHLTREEIESCTGYHI
jgi:hypothetical protein